MTRDELLGLLARLRRATVGGIRAPHKPLLLLWLFGRFATAGSSAAAYEEAGEPVSTLLTTSARLSRPGAVRAAPCAVRPGRAGANDGSAHPGVQPLRGP
jgi:hypothetical protein